MFAQTTGGTVYGIEGHLVRVEADISRGLPMFDVVGLPDTSVRESRDLVRTAIRNSGFAFPTGRVVVNLAPADLPKTGPACDLAIALAVLAAAGVLREDALAGVCVVGELSLDGAVRRVPGLLSIALAARE
ncbi:MAG: magnesium chelatase domain-containing protein, partial [Limnochordales bacterium]